MKRWVPWWAKMLAKLVLARLPVGYAGFARLGISVHGEMADFDYARSVVEDHVRRAGVDLRGAVCLELGPGDSVSSALIARALGASHTYLIDAGAFAATDPKIYQRHARQLLDMGFDVPDLLDCTDLNAVLGELNATYLTEGLTSLAQLPSDSIDFVWSHAVLEHVRLQDFSPTLRELARVTRDGGVGSHRIDLQDHLQNSLNNLRFSAAWWEREWVAASGFYTNRIRYSPMVQLMQQAGFAVTVANVDRWPQLPVPLTAMQAEYTVLGAQELCVKGFNVLLQHNNDTGES